jgi:hypothetical protein
MEEFRQCFPTWRVWSILRLSRVSTLISVETARAIPSKMR